jgi:hypothetical protein
MSIRQHRFDTIAVIKNKIGDLKGKKITIVLANNTAVMGELKSVESEAVVIMNGRLRNNRFLFSEIKELYFDQIE